MLLTLFQFENSVVWTGRNGYCWKQWYSHPYSLPDWVLSVPACSSLIVLSISDDPYPEGNKQPIYIYEPLLPVVNSTWMDLVVCANSFTSSPIKAKKSLVLLFAIAVHLLSSLLQLSNQLSTSCFLQQAHDEFRWIIMWYTFSGMSLKRLSGQWSPYF